MIGDYWEIMQFSFLKLKDPYFLKNMMHVADIILVRSNINITNIQL